MPELRRGYQVSPRYIQERLSLNMSSLGNLKGLRRMHRDSRNDEYKINWGPVAVTAAKGGHLNILNWIKSIDPAETRSTMTSNFWNHEIPAAAAESNRLNVLEWLYGNFKFLKLNPKVCAAAVKGGHLELLKWLRYKGVPWCADCCIEAARANNLDLLRWLRDPDRKKEYGEKCPWNSRVCAAAAETGNLELLQELRSYDSEMGRCRWDSWTCARAAEHGYLDIITWARTQVRRCRWDKWTCTLAARHGHLDILVWCRNRNKPCPWDESTCAAAAAGEHFEVLVYLRTGKLPDDFPKVDEKVKFEPCPWNQRVPIVAINQNNLTILSWSLQQGCEWDYQKCEDLAEDKPIILKWLNTEGKTYQQPENIETARICRS